MSHVIRSLVHKMGGLVLWIGSYAYITIVLMVSNVGPL
jgi:hypothetical protein